MFRVQSPYQMAGDQPAAVDALSAALSNGEKWVTLHGITGSGKSAVMAWTIERAQRPALVIAPNKSLAAQLASELAELLPDNKVCYFVSYYDFYQPEAYVPSSDVFIDKEAVVNTEIDRLRHEATGALLSRRDVVVVASVSCIYGLGAPETYRRQLLTLRCGEERDRDQVARHLVDRGFERNDITVDRGRFRIRGDVMDIHLPGEENLWKIEWFGDTIERIRPLDPVTNECGDQTQDLYIWPATHYATEAETNTETVKRISDELDERLRELRTEGKLLEAQRLEQRCRHDIDMIVETGTCAGIENYSRHMDGRQAGEPPYTLIDYFDTDKLVFLDESHVAIPQLHSSWKGDASRKATLIEHGFRLPSAADNRPLRWEEFVDRTTQVVCVSATPGPFEHDNSSTTVPMIVRPTGLLDPTIVVKPQEGQLEDLQQRIRQRTERNERTLVTCTTKKSAEQLCDWMLERNIKARFMHSDVSTLERIELVRNMRLGAYDVLVGVNLLREGLDIPEVSLVAILDADTQGFLRSAVALIQTVGRAARNENGEAVMYATTVTPAMQQTIDETARRRAIQTAHNTTHGIVPKTVTNSIKELVAQTGTSGKKPHRRSQIAATPIDDTKYATRTVEELTAIAASIEDQMDIAASELRFEDAAELRDQLAAIEHAIDTRHHNG